MADHPKYWFEIRRAKNRKYYWHLKARNGRLIAWSGQEFREKAKCLDSLNLVRAFSSDAPACDYSEPGTAEVDASDYVKRLRSGEATE